MSIITGTKWASTRKIFCTSVGRVFVFFFQAEDGIRDYKVTGVQTCALPISQPYPTSSVFLVTNLTNPSRHLGDYLAACLNVMPFWASAARLGEFFLANLLASEIGRASCRERV